MFSRLSGVLSGCPPSIPYPSPPFLTVQISWSRPGGGAKLLYLTGSWNERFACARYFSLHLTGRLLASLGGEIIDRERKDLASKSQTEIEPTNYPLVAKASRSSFLLFVCCSSIQGVLAATSKISKNVTWENSGDYEVKFLFLSFFFLFFFHSWHFAFSEKIDVRNWSKSSYTWWFLGI